MSILSFSFQGDTTERITAWEREIATYERDSGKILDDEIKVVGAVLLRLPESQLKTHLLMCVDKLKKWTDFRDEVVAISRAIAIAQSQPTQTDIGAVDQEIRPELARDRKELANVSIRLSKYVPGAEHGSHFCKLTNVPKMWKGWSSGKCVSIFWNSSAQGHGGQNGKGGGKGANAVNMCWNCGERGHISSQCPRRRSLRWTNPPLRVRLAAKTQPWLDRSRGADEKIFSMGAPIVREGESVDIENDSGAEESCFLVNIGADTYPLQRSPRCGWWRQTA